MSRHLTLALLLSAMTVPVFATESVELGFAGECPERKANPAEAPAEAKSAGNSEVASGGGGGEAAAAPQRIRPRWQSFLPGMMR